jgi:regulation of enolase protein 1 (concanavalin A-like superfamily)
LTWLARHVGDASTDGSRLEMVAPPASDWFNDPLGPTRNSSAPAAVFVPDGDFQLAANVSVEFESAFDAGVLFVHETNDDYAKLCFEYSPDRQPTVVTVVTRDVSDDANGPVIDGRTVWLRVSRIGSTYAFHHSLDGRRWTMTRLFSMRHRVASASVGFLAQSPTGKSCRIVFDDVSYRQETLDDVRNGS